MGLAILATRSYVTTQGRLYMCWRNETIADFANHCITSCIAILADIFNTSIFLQNFKTLHWYKVRWSVARSLLRGNINAPKESISAFSTSSVSEQAHKSPSRPLSSVPLPQEVKLVDSKINIKTPVPGTYNVLFFKIF